jgi:hypothetical protein
MKNVAARDQSPQQGRHDVLTHRPVENRGIDASSDVTDGTAAIVRNEARTRLKISVVAAPDIGKDFAASPRSFHREAGNSGLAADVPDALPIFRVQTKWSDGQPLLIVCGWISNFGWLCERQGLGRFDFAGGQLT